MRKTIRRRRNSNNTGEVLDLTPEVFFYNILHKTPIKKDEAIVHMPKKKASNRKFVPDGTLMLYSVEKTLIELLKIC